MMKHVCRLAVIALLTFAYSGASHATVDGILLANIIYQEPQDENVYCYSRVPVWGEIGIPPAIVAQASLAPSYAYLAVSSPSGWTEAQVIDNRHYINLNAIARGAAIGHTYVNDAITGSGVVEYEVELDLSALSAFNGATKEGRQKTVTQAKLAMLALAKNLKDLSSVGLYRLRVSFKGLPSQSDLDGTPVYASSAWAYTGGSPVLAAYEKELISPYCAGGTQSALYGKTDAITDTTSEPSTAGCAVAPRAQVLGLLPLLALAGLALLRRRR